MKGQICQKTPELKWKGEQGKLEKVAHEDPETKKSAAANETKSEDRQVFDGTREENKLSLCIFEHRPSTLFLFNHRTIFINSF